MTGWRFFVVGMLVGGGLVLLGVIVGASLVASRPAGPDGVSPGPDRSAAGTVLPVVPMATATLVPTATPIPIVSCTLASGQGDATVTFTAPAPNGMCQALLGKQSDVQGRAFALCQATGLNPVTAAACSLVLRRYLSGLSIAPGRASTGTVSCEGTLGEASYEVRDTRNQYVGRALCWYLAHEAT